jgi:hypothetical protein
MVDSQSLLLLMRERAGITAQALSARAGAPLIEFGYRRLVVGEPQVEADGEHVTVSVADVHEDSQQGGAILIRVHVSSGVGKPVNQQKFLVLVVSVELARWHGEGATNDPDSAQVLTELIWGTFKQPVPVRVSRAELEPMADWLLELPAAVDGSDRANQFCEQVLRVLAP